MELSSTNIANVAWSNSPVAAVDRTGLPTIDFRLGSRPVAGNKKNLPEGIAVFQGT